MKIYILVEFFQYEMGFNIVQVSNDRKLLSTIMDDLEKTNHDEGWNSLYRIEEKVIMFNY